MLDDPGEAAGVLGAVCALAAVPVAAHFLGIGEWIAYVAIALSVVAYGLWWWWPAKG